VLVLYYLCVGAVVTDSDSGGGVDNDDLGGLSKIVFTKDVKIK
jgi:hypothetical protein